MQVGLWLLGVVVGGVVVMVLDALVADRVHYALAWAFGRHRGKAREVQGFWKGRYEFPRAGRTLVEEHLFSLRKVGRYVVAKTPYAGDAFYTLRGRLDRETFLTGMWEERTPDGRHYDGSFQLVLSPLGNTMTGRWVGFNREYAVMSGRWQWERLKQRPSREQVAEWYNQAAWSQVGREGEAPDAVGLEDREQEATSSGASLRNERRIG